MQHEWALREDMLGQGGYRACGVVAVLLLALPRLVDRGRVVDELAVAHAHNKGFELAVARQRAAHLQYALHELLQRVSATDTQMGPIGARTLIEKHARRRG